MRSLPFIVTFLASGNAELGRTMVEAESRLAAAYLCMFKALRRDKIIAIMDVIDPRGRSIGPVGPLHPFTFSEALRTTLTHVRYHLLMSESDIELIETTVEQKADALDRLLRRGRHSGRTLLSHLIDDQEDSLPRNFPSLCESFANVVPADAPELILHSRAAIQAYLTVLG